MVEDTWATGITAAFVVTTFLFILIRRAHGTTLNPLPALDRQPRTATVIGVHPAPQRRARSDTGEPNDIGLVEVEYADGSGVVRRECLADLFAELALDRFAVGSTWQVYGFDVPRQRCLLTETHDDLPRSGYNLDGLRVRTERQEFPPRTGSPILGVMSFAAKGRIQRVHGARTSWPGDPASAWAQAATTAQPILRPRPVPPVETEFRARFSSRWHRESLERELATGMLCDVYDSPLGIPGGDSDSTTNILIDVRTPDDQAARITEALRIWAERTAAKDAWGQEPGWLIYRTLTSAELFGEDGAGGFIARDCPVEPGGWVLVSESREPEYPDAPYRRAELTRVTFPKWTAAERKARR